MYFKRAAACVLCFLLLSSCQTKTADSPALSRYAVLRFENLTGDTAFEWTGRAASEVLSRALLKALDGPVISTGAISRASAALGARPSGAPGLSAEREAALTAGANRFITGYVERDAGNFRIVAKEGERTFASTAPSLSAGLRDLANQLSPSAGKLPTGNEHALQMLAAGEEGTSQSAAANLREAVTADPNFGLAWSMLVRASVAGGDRASAIAVANEARSHSLDPIDRANIDFEAASLAGDAHAKASALRAMATLNNGDADLLRTLAETEAAAGDFRQAASDWEKIADSEPRNPDVWNQLGYTRAWAGEYTAALEAMQKYGSLRSNDPNAADSTGDVHFLFGKFREAAQSYLQANTINPNFQDGGELYKAAWATFLAGNHEAASSLFTQFEQRRAKQGAVLLAADWTYRTGHQNEARDTLRLAIESGKAPAPLGYSQLAVWDLLAGEREKAQKDAEAGGKPTTPVMLTIRFASLPSASAEEWKRRSEAMIPGENAASLRRIALGYALLLDGRKEEARALWTQIAASAPGTDFFSKAIRARLEGQTVRPLIPDPNALNEFSALPDTL